MQLLFFERNLIHGFAMKNNLNNFHTEKTSRYWTGFANAGLPMSNFIYLIVLGIFLSGCYKDDLDTDVLSDPIHSSWSIPLLTSEFRIQEFNQINDFLEVSEDGSMQLLYRRDSVISKNAASYFDLIQDQGINQEEIFVSDGILEKFFEFATIEDFRLSSIRLFKGQLYYEFDSSMPVGTKVRFHIFDALKGEEEAIFDFEVTASSHSGEFDISDYDLIFGPEDEPNDMGYTFTILNAPGMSPSDPVLFEWSFKNLQGANATGNFGHRIFELGEGTYDLELDGLSNFQGSLKLSAPSIRLIVQNPIGVPFEFEPYVTAFKNGVQSDITLPKVTVKGAQAPGIPEITVIEFDRNNSGVVALFENIPDQIAVSGDLWTNPDGNTGKENFANRFDDLLIHAELIVPLKFSASGVSFTQRFDDINFWSEAPGRIREMTLKFNNTNSFPFDAKFEFIFLDQAENALDTIKIDLIQAAEIDASGKVTVPQKYIFEEDFSEEQVDKIRNSVHADLRITLNTGAQGQQVIQLFDEYFFKTVVSLKADIDYSLPK